MKFSYFDRDERDWERNEFRLFVENFYAPETPTMREHRLAFERDQRRLPVRIRRAYRLTKWRLRDTWSVLLHGLPERD